MAIPNFSSTNSFHLLRSNCTNSTISKPFRQILSYPCLHSKFIIVHSSVLPLIEARPGFESNNQNMNKILLGLLKHPNSNTQELGVEYYEKAKANIEFTPHNTTFKSLLRYLVKSKNWDLILMVCKDMMVYQSLPESGFCATIVSSCIKARKFKVSDKLLECFEIDKKVAAFSYVSAIRSYNKLHMYGISVDLYERMKSSEVVLDPRGFLFVMEAYLKLGNFDKVVEMFSELESGNNLDDLENVVQIYGVLMEALRKSGQGFKAVDEFERMREKGVSSSPLIYASLICSFIEMREIKMVEDLVQEAVSKGMIKDPGLFLKLVIMYVEEGLIERTLDVVKIIKGANLKVSDCIFCAIVNGYAKKRGLKEAAKVYEELVSEGCVPGQVTYSSIINVFFRLGMLSKAKKVFDEMQVRGFDKCVVAYSTMILMYGKTGQLTEAMKLLAKMKERGCEPNVWVYNALIDVHGRANNIRQVEKIWNEMKRKKVRPDRVSYTSVIGAYSRAREYHACTEFYEEYQMNGGKIDLVMAGIMVGVYSKFNRIDELMKLLQNLKSEGIKLDERLYRSALNAMRDAGFQLQTRWLQESFGGSLSETLVDNYVRPK